MKRFNPVWHRLCVITLCFAGATHPSTAESAGSVASIARSEYLTVDGARLFLMVRGDDAGAPVLLWLHGGPGGAERPLFRYYDGDLERQFVVAYWDQRGAGRSFDPDADTAQLTIARHLADLDLVVDRLRRQLGRERIALVGHSWGAALGLLYAQARPHKVAAVIAVAPLVDTLAQQHARYAFVSVEASRRGDRRTLERLQQIGVPPHASVDEVLAMEALADRYGGVFHTRPSRTWLILAGTLRGLVTPWEIPRFIRGNETSLAAMNDELLELDLSESVPSIEVPVFFFLGRYDHHADAVIAAQYLEALRAPVKRVVWFENSAHNVPFEEPDRFMTAVVAALRSLGAAPAS